MMPSPSSRSPLRILLPVAATLWIGALCVSLWASARITTLTDRTQTHREAIRSLAPEMNQFDTYWSTIGRLLGNPASAPHLHEWINTQHPTLSPSAHKEQTSSLEHSRIRMRTATVAWPAIEAGQLQTIVETAQNAPASYRLSAITLSPAARDNKLKVEAVFRAFTQQGNP